MSKDIPYCCLYRISIKNPIRTTISLKYHMIPRIVKSISRYNTQIVPNSLKFKQTIISWINNKLDEFVNRKGGIRLSSTS
jgi:hypothetical protein